MTEPKYKDCICKLPFFMDGKLTAVGAKELNGFNCHIIYAFAYETGLTGLSKKPHVHDYDEAIFFIGSDPQKPGYLGAEVTMAIGADEEATPRSSSVVLLTEFRICEAAFGDDSDLPFMPLVQKWRDNPSLRALLEALNRVHKKGF